MVQASLFALGIQKSHLKPLKINCFWVIVHVWLNLGAGRQVRYILAWWYPWVFCIWIFNIPQHLKLKDITGHVFVVQTNSHILPMMFQQTCSPQINSLGVFTVVSKLLQPTRSGVMVFVTWCLQQFSEAACVCFLCHCISTLEEKEIHKIREMII